MQPIAILGNHDRLRVMAVTTDKVVRRYPPLSRWQRRGKVTSSGAAPEQVRRATMPIQIMVISQLLVLAAVLISLLFGWPWWAALLIAIVSLALVLGRWGGQTVRHWAVTGFKYLTGRTYRSSGSIADTPSGQDSWTGTRWENGKLITVLEISATQRHPSVITPDHCATDSLVPLRVLRECMHQNDIELESIDVISNGQRTAQGTVLRGGYDRLVGPLPAVAIRTVWVVLRFDPGANVDAVFRRGGGRRGRKDAPSSPRPESGVPWRPPIAPAPSCRPARFTASAPKCCGSTRVHPCMRTGAASP